MGRKYENVTVVFNEDILTRECAEVTLAFNPDTSDMFEFNDSGADVFNLIKRGLQYNELINELCKMYSVEPDDIYDDVDEIISRMIEVGIINVSE